LQIDPFMTPKERRYAHAAGNKRMGGADELLRLCKADRV
jgi:hypothetical protein